MAEGVKVLSQTSFNADVSKGLVLVDFYASWCGPCKMLAPILEQIAQAYGAKLMVGKVNVDENEELCLRLDISSMPTVILFKEGLEVGRFMGLRDQSFLKNFIDKHL